MKIPRFKPYNHKQLMLLMVDFEEQIQAGTFEHAIHYLIENKFDLTVFHPRYVNEKKGCKAYDPAIMLKIILFAYSKGITSSREIEWCCQKNIIFKALSCDSVPHFTTIANFVSSIPDQIESLFEQILLVCHEQGLLGNEMFAIDGCKISSNAAKEWSGTIKELQEKRAKLKRLIRHHMDKHQELDQAETYDEERRKRTEQTINTLDKAFNKIDNFLKTSEPRIGKGKAGKEVKSNITDNESAKIKGSKGTIQGYSGLGAADKKHQVIIDAQAFGEGQEQHTLQPIIESIKDLYQRLGISDDIYKDGAIVTADTGFADEKNMKYLHENKIDGYVPDGQFRSRDPKFADQKAKHGKLKPKKRKTGKIPSSEFQFDPVNKTCICPSGESLRSKCEKADKLGHQKIHFEARILQCRHCELKKECLRNPDSADHPKGHGRQVSFILEKNRAPNYTDWMKHRVDGQKGKEIYGHRMSVIEPVFGNIVNNKKLNRFSLRGKTKVNAQWKLFCMVHNIEKLTNYGKMAA